MKIARPHRLGFFLIMFAGFAASGIVAAEPPATAPRERVSLNAGWRFIKDDPTWLQAGSSLMKRQPALSETRSRGAVAGGSAATMPLAANPANIIRKKPRR